MNAQGFYISSQNRGPTGRLADWSRVKVDYVHIRVLDGLQPDPDAAHNISGAREAGIPWSAVQSFYPWLDVGKQAWALADYALDAPLGGAADFEVSGGLSPWRYMLLAEDYCSVFGEASTRPLLVYTSAWLGTAYLPTGWGTTQLLWIANPDSNSPHLPLQWTAWRFWQDDWNWSTPGVSDPTICHDQFNGAPADLAALYHLAPQTDPLKEWRAPLPGWARGGGEGGPEPP